MNSTKMHHQIPSSQVTLDSEEPIPNSTSAEAMVKSRESRRQSTMTCLAKLILLNFRHEPTLEMRRVHRIVRMVRQTRK